MGKAINWLRSLLSTKKPLASSTATEKKKKSKWARSNSANSSVKFKNHVEEPLFSPYIDGLDANKHAIAVAAATAAVAEAALAAAQAAAQVVRLTGGSGSGRSAPYIGFDRRSVLAAVKIQTAFRAYLARKALRALKGLVKLQALVRGHIVRKQSADMLHRMQTMARIQAQASAHRSYSSEFTNAKTKFSNSHRQQNHSTSHIGGSVNNKETSHLTSRWSDHWMEQCTWNNLPDERSDKILEIDTWKPNRNISRNDRTVNTSHYFSAWNDMGQDYSNIGPSSLYSKLQKPNPSISSEEVSSVMSSKFPPEGDQVAAWTADNKPRVRSVASRPTSNLRGPFSPARTECSRSMYGDYLGHPSYMANTESSRAKVRSHSAPKQRLQSEELRGNAKFGRDLWDSDTISEKGSAFLSNRRNNTFLHSGHVKRQANPTSDAALGFGSIYGRRLL